MENNNIFNVAKDGNITEIKQALSDGMDINSTWKNDANQSMLFYAAAYNHLELVKFLVENGININAVDKYGNTALHQAARKGFLPIVKYLVGNGGNVNHQNEKKVTPFNEAIYYNHLECAEYLLGKGADIDNHFDLDYDFGITSLHFAVGGGFTYSKDLVKFLIEKGANVCETDAENNLLLATAVKQNTLTAQIVKAAKNINIRDKEGKTVLHHAAANDSLRPLKNLLKHKDLDLNITDNDGKPPLFYSNNESAAVFLIKRGAKYDKTSNYDDLFMRLYGDKHIDLDKLNTLRMEHTY